MKQNESFVHKGEKPVELILGKKVVLQNNATKKWDIFGHIISLTGLRSCRVKCGKYVYLRNRRFLKNDPRELAKNLEMSVSKISHGAKMKTREGSQKIKSILKGKTQNKKGENLHVSFQLGCLHKKFSLGNGLENCGQAILDTKQGLCCCMLNQASLGKQAHNFCDGKRVKNSHS